MCVSIKGKWSKQQHILVKKPLLAVHTWFLIFKFKEKSKKLPCSSINVRLIILGQTSRKV